MAKVKSIRAYLKNLALSKPYTIANLVCADVENVFLEVELANGITGTGAANPAPEVVGETPEQCLQQCQSDIFLALEGRNIHDYQQIIREINAAFPYAPGTVAALDIALHDAFAQYKGVRVVDLYGQKIQQLPTSVTIGIMNVKDTLAEAVDFLRNGFTILKIKTGMDVDEDIERIVRLHEHFGAQIRIRVDANQGYTRADLERFLSATAHVPLELIEQPLPVGQENDLLYFPSKTRKLLVADESLKSPVSAALLAREPQPFGIFNIKLMKCGGILAALELANIGEQAGIDLFWGCNDESRVSIAAALHVAFACANTRYLDLDGSFDLAEDLVSGGFVVENGMMRLAEGPGLGINRF